MLSPSPKGDTGTAPAKKETMAHTKETPTMRYTVHLKSTGAETDYDSYGDAMRACSAAVQHIKCPPHKRSITKTAQYWSPGQIIWYAYDKQEHHND